MNREPTQKEIDILIEGRELIDGCKAVKSQCVKVLLTYDKRKSFPKEKPSKKEMDDRIAIATTETEAIQYRDERLKKLGFDYDSFAKFNREMVVAEVQWHMIRIVQVCDHCRGYDGIPPCRLTCGAHSWNAKKPNKMAELEKADSLFIRDDVFFQWIQQIDYDKKGHAKIRYPKLDHSDTARRLGFDLIKEYEVDGVLHIKIGGCPDGHGLVSKYVAPARFDLHWSANLAREVPRLHDYLISNGE